MTLEDPYYAVKDEVAKALTKIRSLQARYAELKDVVAGRSVPQTPLLSLGGGVFPMLNSREELEWTLTELKNALRSIEWDLEDLEETLVTVQKNPGKFKVNSKELAVRRIFIEHVRAEVKIMKDKLNITNTRVSDRDTTVRQPESESPTKSPPANHGTAKYSKLETQTDSPSHQFHVICNQNAMVHREELLNFMSNSNGGLKTVSRHINPEFDERQVMLDDFNNEMEIIHDSTTLDSTMKKMAKVLHINNGNYNNYVPAPTTSVPETTEYIPRPCSLSCSLSSISTTITNCFLCRRE